MTKFQFRYICMILMFVLGNTAGSELGEWIGCALGLGFGVGACIAARKEYKQ